MLENRDRECRALLGPLGMSPRPVLTTHRARPMVLSYPALRATSISLRDGWAPCVRTIPADSSSHNLLSSIPIRVRLTSESPIAFYDGLARDPKSEKEFWTIIEETFDQVESVLTDHPIETHVVRHHGRGECHRSPCH